MYYATGDTDLNTGATEVTYHVRVATGAPEGHGLSLVTLLVLLRPHSGCAVLRKFQHFLMPACIRFTSPRARWPSPGAPFYE
jgi:hypothetical protein